MGQQHSQEKGERIKPQELQKKVNRRQSIQTLGVSRSRGADPSFDSTPASATTTSRHLDTPHLQQYLEKTSPDGKTKIGRSPSRREKQVDQERGSKHAQPIQPSGPMNVPVRTRPEDIEKKTYEKPFEERPPEYDERRYVPPAQLRPPRFPLPIADTVPPPDSPTLDPVDKGNADVPIFEPDEPVSATEPHLRRKSSMLSAATDDEDEPAQELPEVDLGQKMIQTTIEYNHTGAQRVYVTGTFANWERKFRMHHKPDGSGWYTKIDLPPGTHHMMFLVDDRMTADSTIPQTVDFNNVLVNFIEIAHEDVYKSRRESTQTATDKRDSTQAPQLQPTSDELEPPTEEGDESTDGDREPRPEEMEPGDFRSIMPQALIDMDLSEDDQRWQQASRVIGDSQGPPTLPMFLGKSILNMTAPVKDDGSVLVLPNHTVLNHLMTSSVKNGVLATSVTTRYKKKYVTTISFKPVPVVHAAAS